MRNTFLGAIAELVRTGVLGHEINPGRPGKTYYHWPVLRPEDLPEWLESKYEYYGEIRYYEN
jgi:hypothetical protein